MPAGRPAAPLSTSQSKAYVAMYNNPTARSTQAARDIGKADYTTTYVKPVAAAKPQADPYGGWDAASLIAATMAEAQNQGVASQGSSGGGGGGYGGGAAYNPAAVRAQKDAFNAEMWAGGQALDTQANNARTLSGQAQGTIQSEQDRMMAQIAQARIQQQQAEAQRQQQVNIALQGNQGQFDALAQRARGEGIDPSVIGLRQADLASTQNAAQMFGANVTASNNQLLQGTESAAGLSGQSAQSARALNEQQILNQIAAQKMALEGKWRANLASIGETPDTWASAGLPGDTGGAPKSYDQQVVEAMYRQQQGQPAQPAAQSYEQQVLAALVQQQQQKDYENQILMAMAGRR